MNKNKTVLSVIPGRHRFGYAVFCQNILTYYGIACLSNFKTKVEVNKALERFLSKTVSQFQIKQIAIRKVTKAQAQSILLDDLVENLKTICQRQKVKVLSYHHHQINQPFCNKNERPNKEKTAITLTAKYPELKRFRSVKKDWQKRYYASLFQAIALGLVCLSEINNQESRKQNRK